MKTAVIALLFAATVFAGLTTEDKLRAQKSFREAQLKASNDQIALANAMMQAKASQEAVQAGAVELGKTLKCEVDPQTADCKPEPKPPAK